MKLGKTAIITCPKMMPDEVRFILENSSKVSFVESDLWRYAHFISDSDKKEEYEGKSHFEGTEKLERIVEEADSIFIGGQKCILTEKMIDAGKNLKYIGVHATGYENLLPKIRNENIKITFIPNYATDPTSELTASSATYRSSIAAHAITAQACLALRHVWISNEVVKGGNEEELGGNILGTQLYKGETIPILNGAVPQGVVREALEYAYKCDFSRENRETVPIAFDHNPFSDKDRRKISRAPVKKAALFGFGNVGSETAGILRRLGIELAFTTKHPEMHMKKAEEIGAVYENDIQKLVKDADVIIFAVPETYDTKGIINKDIFKKMKEGAMIINYARTGLYNMKDLTEWFPKRKFYLCTDQIYRWNDPNECRFLSICREKGLWDRGIFTPHTAWYTPQAMRKKEKMNIGNIKEFFEFAEGKRKKLTNEINYSHVRK